MGFWLNLLGIMPVQGGKAVPAPRASGETFGLNSPQLRELIRSGSTGIDALRNSAVNRSVSVIANAIGHLPLQVYQRDSSGVPSTKATDNPLYGLLMRQPNNWQTPFVFKRTMQMRAIMRGNAYALPLRVGGRVTELIPLPPDKVRTEQTDDWSVVHIVTGARGETRYKAGELLHLIGFSEDGIKGIPVMDYARDVLELSRESDNAMRAGLMRGYRPGGALEMEGRLSDEAHARLKADLAQNYRGAENAGEFMVLEGGMKARLFEMNAREAQSVEFRNQQIEEVARIFGMPRPFLMMDDTSWGSGIEQLAIFFVQYTLAPWFAAWEQAIAMTLLAPAERERLIIKFNEKALMRGSMKDQAEFLAKMTGSGGSQQIMEANEARAALDLPPHPDGAGLANAMMKGAAA